MITANQYILANSYYGIALRAAKKPKVKTSVRINGQVIRLEDEEAERIYKQRRIRDYMEWAHLYFTENGIDPVARYYDETLSDKEKLKIRRHYEREVAKKVCELIDSHSFSDIIDACSEAYDMLMNNTLEESA